jgi:hypothetical protein
MNPCALCGVALWGDARLCLSHHGVAYDDFAASNRIWCDFVHRGIAPQRLSAAARDDADMA